MSRLNEANVILAREIIGRYPKARSATIPLLHLSQQQNGYVTNEAIAHIAELVGAQPVTVQAAELSQAMATGVIESYMSSGSTGFDTKTYEHIKNWYDTQAWLPKNAIIVNQKAFDALDKPTQAALLKAAADAETRGWKLSEEKNGWYIAQLKDKGMSIVKPSDQLTADLRRVGNHMLAEWQRKSGDEGKKVIDAYRGM